jgi:pimeloyl-ACP methyl ester carboxylesterase
MKTPQDRYIKVGKINTRYWAEGSEGSPVILIHGLGGYIESWLPNFDTLATQYQVYAVDLLGHGRTEKPLDVSYTIANLTQFVSDFMAALGIEQAHVVGHSLGGAIGTRLALAFPTAVDKLVLVDSAGLGKEATIVLRIASVPFLGEMLTRPSRSGSASSGKMLVYDPEIMTDELVELNYQMAALPGAQKSFLKTLRAVGNLLGQKKSTYGPNVRGLPSITHPVLVIWGRQDKTVPVMHAEVAAKGLPNVRVKILDNCGHLPMLEHSQVFNELLLEFLSN